MEREQLKQQLSELHQELRSGELDDPEVQELLQQLAGDIDGLLEKTAPEAADEDASEAELVEEKESLLDRLLSVTEEFEDSYPRLSEVIGRVASALSRIGI